MDLRPNKDFVGSSALASYAVELCPIATTVLIAVRENASNIILDSIFVPLIEVIAGNKYGVELDLGSTDVVLWMGRPSRVGICVLLWLIILVPSKL